MIQKQKHKQRHAALWSIAGAWELSKAKTGITVIARNGIGVIGKLSIGQGGLFWIPRHKHLGRHFSWTSFAALMNTYAQS